MIRINLLPVREARRRANIQQQAVLLGVVVAVSLLATGYLRFALQSEIAEAQSKVTKLDQKIKRFAPQLEKVDAYKKKKAAVEKKLSVIQELDAERSGPVRILDEISNRTPDRLWLTKLDASSNRLDVDGLSLENEIIAQFLTRLSDSQYFKNVELKKSELQNKKGLKIQRFQVHAAITSPEAEARAAAQKKKAPGPKPAKSKRRKKAELESPAVAEIW